MVLFIMCLVAGVLGIVTLAHYVIEKPMKARMRKAVSDYLRRKASHNNHTNNNTNLNSAAGSHNSLTNKQVHGSGPMITVTDCSSSKNLAASSSKIHEESRETDPLLLTASGNDLSSGGSQVHSSFTPVFSGTNKVKFHVGETIIEESFTSSPNSSQNKLAEDASSNNEGDTKTEANNVEDSETTELNEECIKSISHLLDDKPWLTSPQSQSQLAMTRKDSRASILPFMQISNDTGNNL
jgi:hypothetical protein